MTPPRSSGLETRPIPVRRVLFLGGNGHCAARLAPAREVLGRGVSDGEIPSLELLDVPYPGFEGRPAVPDLESFLDTLRENLAALVPGTTANTITRKL